jgi:hypothetical protein
MRYHINPVRTTVTKKMEGEHGWGCGGKNLYVLLVGIQIRTAITLKPYGSSSKTKKRNVT